MSNNISNTQLGCSALISTNIVITTDIEVAKKDSIFIGGQEFKISKRASKSILKNNVYLIKLEKHVLHVPAFPRARGNLQQSIALPKLVSGEVCFQTEESKLFALSGKEGIIFQFSLELNSWIDNAIISDALGTMNCKFSY